MTKNELISLINERTVVKGMSKPDYVSNAMTTANEFIQTLEYFQSLIEKKSFSDEAFAYKVSEVLDETGVLRSEMIELNTWLEELPNKEDVKKPIGFLREDEK